MSTAHPLLRLASYNIRKAVGTDRRRSPGRVLEVVADLAADIVVLQEADRRLGDRPAVLPAAEIAHRTDLHPVPLDPGGVSLGWHGIALLLRPSVTVTDLCLMDLPSLEPRGAVIADLETPIGPIRVVGVHMGLLRASRRRQIDAILAHIEAMPPRPTAIIGDFNEWSRRAGLGRLATGFAIHAPGPSFHARRPVAALDRLAIGPGLGTAAMGVHRSGLAARASDHLPIWADLCRADPA
ncbi:endonuclease/exonuclease/phosphatase family metal-dependent hydrolase [Palleronia aestuarii]|uniref:Endonuclease/exonuclease/phosphatase family metal-dependent hydrolase n=1 Tax=Palleronia aestuarii TaxID=568105 RepID=A0A2W7NSU5_9RHOB|nr:endonuclease/exonuclease/phosphatase family protein [Palleronia aestuarii]PZX14322.1 endonuclease/exonuclease/phosphatase family metal-dependent hydrolase [Palleronia aestuarii]